MKVAHIITRLIVGGAQENTLHTAEDLHRLHGDEVTLITGPGLGPEGSLEDRARAGGYRLEILPELKRAISPWADWKAYRRLIALLNEIQPDIVHTHSSKAGILGRMAAARLGLPAVHTVHGASFHFGQSALAYRAYIAAERKVAGQTAKFISVADAMTREYVAACIAPAEKFTTIYSGFAVEPFLMPSRPIAEIRDELGIRPEEVVVGKVGRLFHLKGHEFLIRAAPTILAAMPQVRFLLVGDGILRDSIEAELTRLGIRHRFTFTGLVRPEAIPDLIHAMDIVVHTSQWEGLARVLPQGLIAGKPVVAYDVGGSAEIVIPGETGYLLPRDSYGPLVEAVGELARDADLRQRLGQAGRERFTEQFRHEHMTARIRDVYQAVLNAD
jgi:glycosyltransferase involved in cell wall biosynthesis